jgi:COP9 signalosome complex subunit 1
MQLNLHLYSHANYLVDRIREGLVLQYFFPYATTDLNRMAAAFGMSVAEMEQTVAGLIAKGQLPARIDSQAKTLHRRQTDDRTLSLEKVLRLARVHARETHSALLRLSLLESEYVVGTSREDRR